VRRVVVTGIGLLSPFGEGLDTTLDAIARGETGVRLLPEFQDWKGLRTKIGAPQPDLDYASGIAPKYRRSMSGAALLGMHTTLQSLEDASICLDDPVLSDGRTGVAFGSGIGSTDEIAAFALASERKEAKGLTALSYHKIMAHSCAANISVYLGCTGRLIPTSSACTSGSLAIGLGYEEVLLGRHQIMIVGGAEYLTPAVAAVFDSMYATSTKNDTPHLASAPFDAERDGLVVGGGSCTLILEEREHALRRGAKIYAEVSGFATNNDGYHVTQPNPTTIERVMRNALESAHLVPSDIDYVNAHATGTPVGDLVEAQATHAVFGENTPVASLKGYLGHTLGACGAIETALTIGQMRRGVLFENRNLLMVDPKCASLNFIRSNRSDLRLRHTISNTFAFGGVNTAIVLSTAEDRDEG
jgi:3-oxoacyl-[acyl-carrier-protein] synthase II